MKRLWIVIGLLVLGFALAIVVPCLRAGETKGSNRYQVLAPIRHGNLTIFPVVSQASHDTAQFLTLDEGLRSGDVIVTEAGGTSPLVRPRHPHPVLDERPHGGGAQVNTLVLVNNSKRPLLLLAGEIVTGGKQDRIIGKDRLVPAESDPIDLSVFCVEPGRWVGTSAKFSVMQGANDLVGGLVQPSVRAKAMGEKNQQQVWNEVSKARMGAAETVTVEAAPAVAQTSSYAGVIANREVQKQVDAIAVPIEQEYHSVIAQLRYKNAVGVVVAVNGQLIWADVFASTNLLQKYWPKLVRSYAAETFSSVSKGGAVDVSAAQRFLDQLQGNREVIENEPGLYRHSEISGDGYKVFELTALLPSTGFDLHLAKMAD